MIESYSFGHIKVDGKEYNADLLIYPDHVYASWWRKEGHRLSLSDVETVFRGKPDILVIGTGDMGMMAVPPEIADAIKAKGIELHVEKTGKACDLLNGFHKEGRLAVGAFHLTC